ncbi:hypothetical protein ABS767_02730 [Sphingomonas sp. ST-64]|uniref:EpsG family protein n=1 Tax=Sphingomonas plantiphila TaxID=3163295 RepID=A0ABW8YL48_9SPHN
MNRPQHPTFKHGGLQHSRVGLLRSIDPTSIVLIAVISVALGYFLASTLVVTEAQDAYQYRLNLDLGVYDESNSTLFAFVVRTLVALFPYADPFILIGTFTCASYLYLTFRTGAAWYKQAIFLVLLLLPLLEFNYTQVIRQGAANALILHALFTPAWPVAAVLLVAGGAMHLTYAPFALAILVRLYLFRNERDLTLVHTPREIRFDRIVVIALPLLWAILFIYQDQLFSEERTEIYITYDTNIFKRVGVSSALLGLAWLLYPKTRGSLASFMAFATVSVAIVLPFTYDFLRMQTYVMPFIAFTALMCRDDRRALAALGVCLAISLYVQPNFDRAMP